MQEDWKTIVEIGLLATICFVAGVLVMAMGIPRVSTSLGEISRPSYLPNPILTPGSINPNITQANIGQNICNKNWSTKSIRPPSSYTTALKIKQIQQYGFADTKTADFEEDHLISLELGGNPTDPKNLWPELYLPKPGAREKDHLENYLHAQVCAGKMTLAEAQKAISTDWYSTYQKVGLDKNLGGIIIDEGDE